MAPTQLSQIWLKKIKVVHTLLSRYSPKYELSTPNSFVTKKCFRGEGVPTLKTLFEQRFVKSHFQIAITRKVFKLARGGFSYRGERGCPGGPPKGGAKKTPPKKKKKKKRIVGFFLRPLL